MDPVDPPAFGTGQADEPSLLFCMLQQLAVPLISFVLLLVVPAVPWHFMKSVIGQAAEVVRSIAVSSLIGFALGLFAFRFLPSARVTAQWLWVLPMLLLLLVFLLGSITSSTSRSLRTTLFPGPDGEEGWFFYLLTCPTVATAAYSVAIRWRVAVRHR